MGNLVKALRDDANGATLDWVLLSVGILLLGTLTVYEVYVGATNELVSEINQSLGKDPVVRMDPSANVSGTESLPASLSAECENLLEKEHTGALLAECLPEDPVDD